MTTMNRDSQLADFCAQLPELRRALAGSDLAGVLEDVRHRIEAGADVATELARLGVPPPSVTRETGYSLALGRRSGWSPAPRYVCPAGLCRRAERREPGGPVPECSLTSAVLRPER